ncbi:MAG: transposase [Planctomycetes bacterium]|nr:transposase [Planctomycetota bacterium]MCB9911464.1 transposase [Planctomycetota bacterium]
MESGAKVTEVPRERGMCAGTFCRWHAKYGGLNVSEARHLKQLGDENRRLKRMVRDLSWTCRP